MKKLITIAAIAASMVFVPVHAAVLDFAAEADTNGERGIPSIGNLTIGGITVRLAGAANVDRQQDNIGILNSYDLVAAYLDAGQAGLGTCKVLDANDQCDPTNDDNVSDGELIEVGFIGAQAGVIDITSLLFRDSQHNIIDANNDGLVRITTNNGSIEALFSVFVTMAAAGDAFFTDLMFIGFDHVDKDFYVSAIGVSDVPIPAALPLFLSGVAGMGIAARRRKNEA